MCFRPSSIRLAISISPSRVSSSTEPISRMYMRTGSVVRPNSESSVDAAASASSSTSSAGTVGGRLGHQQRFGVGRLVVDLDAHVADHRDDAFDLLGIEDVVGQVVVDLGVRQVAALLAEHDQLLQPALARLDVGGRQLARRNLGVLAVLPFLCARPRRACRRCARRSRPPSACAPPASSQLRRPRHSACRSTCRRRRPACRA